MQAQVDPQEGLQLWQLTFLGDQLHLVRATRGLSTQYLKLVKKPLHRCFCLRDIFKPLDRREGISGHVQVTARLAGCSKRQVLRI